MYRQILPALLVIFGLILWADAGLAASIQYTAQPPMIASATVDADRRTLVVSGWHFGKSSAIVALGNRVLKVKSHSNSKLVVELPTSSAPSRSARRSSRRASTPHRPRRGELIPGAERFVLV